jgi:hypothetical protein
MNLVALSSGFLHEPIVTRARVAHPETGVPVVKSDISSVKLWAYCGTLVEEVTLDEDDVWQDTLQAWDVDGVGWNFEHVVRRGTPVDWSGGQAVELEYVVTVTAFGGDYPIVLAKRHSVVAMRTRELT